MQLGATLCRVQREDHFAELTSKLRPDMYMLLYFKWMMTKDLLYGTGNCAQCYVAAGMEGALGENGNTYTCGWVPLLSTWNDHNIVSQLCCCAVTKSGSTLCDPMDSSMPGSPVLHHLPKCAQVHVYWIGDAIQTSHSLSPPSPPAFNLSQHQDLFQWVSSLHQVAKVLELSPKQNKMLKKKKTQTETWVTKKSQRAGRRGLQERELSCERPWGGRGPGVSGHHSQGRRVLRAEARRDLREAGPLHTETLQGKVTSFNQILREWWGNSCYKGPESIWALQGMWSLSQLRNLTFINKDKYKWVSATRFQ